MSKPTDKPAIPTDHDIRLLYNESGQSQPPPGMMFHTIHVESGLLIDGNVTTNTWSSFVGNRWLAHMELGLGDRYWLKDGKEMWEISPSHRRAIRFALDDTPAPVRDPLADLMQWKSLGVEHVELDDIVGWALVVQLPVQAQYYYRKRAEEMKHVFGVQNVDPFLPTCGKIIVDETGRKLLAMWIGNEGMGLFCQRQSTECLPVKQSLFEIPPGFTRLTPKTENEALALTRE